MPTESGTPEPASTWRPALVSDVGVDENLSLLTAVRRGTFNRCPNCGEGKVFSGFLKIVPECSVCHAPLGLLRADDAPPYIVIFVAGHLLLPPIFWIEKAYEPPMWLHMVVWLPLFALICTLLLTPAKGAVVGWMWKLGFASHGAAPADEPGRGTRPDA